MSYLIGRGRYRRETYPNPAAVPGGVTPFALPWPPTDLGANPKPVVALSMLTPLRKFDNTNGPIEYTTPPNPFDGMVIGIKAAVAAAAPATLHANNPGELVEDASNSGHYVTDSLVPGQGPAVFWKFEKATNKWIGLINV